MQYCKSEILMLKVAPHTPYIRVFTEKKNGKCNYAISIVLCHLLKFSTQLVFFCYGLSACRFTMYFSIGNVSCDSC